MTEPTPQRSLARHRIRRGFTNAELLVVIGIAAVLITIVISVFGKVRALIQSWS